MEEMDTIVSYSATVSSIVFNQFLASKEPKEIEPVIDGNIDNRFIQANTPFDEILSMIELLGVSPD
jgi:hypothetical protein